MGRGLLNDKVAMVTGAGQGLGRAIAREFADEGAAVALLEINPATAAEAEAELKAKGFQAKAYPLDVRITTLMPG
jgi:2,3-dihydro-2,3-dihydroxybenzoate dehydrogenase